jgi:hypothetical protein
MLLLRGKSRTVVDLPVGSIVMLVFLGLVLGVQAPAVGASIGVVVSLALVELFVLVMVVSQLRATARVGDELRLRWSFGVKRWVAGEHVLRAAIRGTRSPILELEIVRRKADRHEPGTTLAVVGASAKGRAQAEAIAELLEIPLTGDLPPCV